MSAPWRRDEIVLAVLICIAVAAIASLPLLHKLGWV